MCKTSNAGSIYLLILPALAPRLFLVILPIFWNIYLSLHDVRFATARQVRNFFGLENYRVLIEGSLFPCKFHKSLGGSVQFVGGSVRGQCVMVARLAAGAIKE